jgi:hypothetical protein
MTHMTTELLLRAGTGTWDQIAESIAAASEDLIAERIERFSVTVQDQNVRIDGHRTADRSIRLTAIGNDELSGRERLTVRDERAVLAVGFSAASPEWGSFFWDWSAPVQPAAMASGVVRTFRDIYKVEPVDLEVLVTL